MFDGGRTSVHIEESLGWHIIIYNTWPAIHLYDTLAFTITLFKFNSFLISDYRESKIDK